MRTKEEQAKRDELITELFQLELVDIELTKGLNKGSANLEGIIRERFDREKRIFKLVRKFHAWQRRQG